MAKLPHKKLLQLNPKFKLALLEAFLNRDRDKGIIAPIALALGVIIILFAVSGILRSYEEKISTSSQRAAATALSAAEIALAKYQELLDNNPAIATYPACNTWTDANSVADDGNRDDNEACSDTGSLQTWKRATNIPGVNQLACPTGGATVVANATTRTWQLINASDSSLGQYRLVDYSYSSTTDSATLIVEGRVRQDRDQPATARLQATIPIQPGLPQTSSPPNLRPLLNLFDPALWIGSSTVTAIGNNLTVNGNIIVSNSNCNVPTGSNQPSTGNLSNPSTQLVMADPRSLPATIILGRNPEDINGNGSIDPGEDRNANGILDYNYNDDTDSDGSICVNNPISGTTPQIGDRDDSDDIINCIDNSMVTGNVEDLDGDGTLDVDLNGNGSIDVEDANNNGKLDTEDTNLNNIEDPGEDLNGDGIFVDEDLNNNGCLDNGVFPRDCFTETEDINGNGTLDPGEDSDSDGVIDAVDVNGNGVIDNLTELKDSNNYYHYLVRDNLNLPDGTTLKIPVGTKVIFYVQGNITFTDNVVVNPGEDLNGNGILDVGEDLDEDLNGNDTLDAGEDLNGNGILDKSNGLLDVNNSAFLEIYGNTDDGSGPKYGCQDPPFTTCPTTTTQVNFNGSGTIRLTGFIHAPGATVRLTGSPNIKLTGAMWINNWNANTSTFNLIPDDQYFNYLSLPNLVAPIVYAPSNQEFQEAD